MLRWGILLLGVAGAGGCRLNATDRAYAENPGAPDGELREVEQLRAEAAMLKTRMEELRGRSQSLSDEVARLKFLNEQLRRQLAAVGDAPKQCDRYREQLAEQLLLIERLKHRVEELEKLLPPGARGAELAPRPEATSKLGQEVR